MHKEAIFHNHFRAFIAPKIGLRPVFNKNENLSKEEIEAYLLAEDQYVATEILKHDGWIAFVKFCKQNDIDDFITKHTPCEGPDGQCGFECSKYEKCVMRRPAKLIFEK